MADQDQEQDKSPSVQMMELPMEVPDEARGLSKFEELDLNTLIHTWVDKPIGMPVRTHPSGLRSCWREIKERKYPYTLMKLQADTSVKGLIRFRSDTQVTELTDLYYQKIAEGKKKHDPMILNRIESKPDLKFTQVTIQSTTVGIYQCEVSLISKYADMLGLHASQLNCYFCMESIALEYGDPDWAATFAKDRENFWRLVEDRSKLLKGLIQEKTFRRHK